MRQHIRGLNGPEPGGRDRLRGVEAYNILIRHDSAEFVVDLRPIFKSGQDSENSCPDEDEELVNAALQEWFKENVFTMSRVERTGSGDLIIC